MISTTVLPAETGGCDTAPRGRRVLGRLTVAHVILVGMLLLAEWVVAEHAWFTTVITQWSLRTCSGNAPSQGERCFGI